MIEMAQIDSKTLVAALREAAQAAAPVRYTAFPQQVAGDAPLPQSFTTRASMSAEDMDMAVARAVSKVLYAMAAAFERAQATEPVARGQTWEEFAEEATRQPMTVPDTACKSRDR